MRRPRFTPRSVASAELRDQRVGAQRLPGRVAQRLAPVAEAPGAVETLLEEASDLGARDVTGPDVAAVPQHPALDVALELGGHDLAKQVVVVVDRRHAEMDLARPVRAIPPFRPGEPLEALDQIPPQPVQVLRGI